MSLTRFFISNAFISNPRQKLAKNLAKAKERIEAERLLFDNYTLFHFGFPAKLIWYMLRIL